MWMVTKAWSNVTENTISNCFKKSGFRVSDVEGEHNNEQPSEPAAADGGLAKNWQKVS